MTPDAFGILALAVTAALATRQILALWLRAAPRPTPTPSDAPPSNQGGANGQPAPDAILDNACAVPKGYGYAWVDPDHLVAEWQETTAPQYGWVVQTDPTPHPSHDTPPTWNCRCVVVYIQPDPPTELDAIAARFDARIDAVLRARSSKEDPGVMKPGDAG